MPNYTQIQLRRDTTANWTIANPVLAEGEFTYDITANKIKIGDGITSWNNLDYALLALSAYEVALNNGFVGTEQEWLDSLKNIEYLVQPITAITYVDSGNSEMDCSLSNTFTLTANGTGTTITQTNIPLTGSRYGFELHLNWVSGTITWSATWNKGDSLPTAVGNYVITGVTIDGGTSWKIAILAE